MAACFVSNSRPDPRLNNKGVADEFLNLQCKGCSKTDPPEQNQRALTPFFLRVVHNRAHAPLQLATAQLLISGFFFAMRSCEYSNTNAEKQTKIMSIKGIRFLRRDNSTIDHSDQDVFNAFAVSVTFENQKNGVKMDRSTQEATGCSILCPVRMAAAIVSRIRLLPNTTPLTPINTFFSGSSIELIHQSMVLSYIQSTAQSIGSDKLGFTPDELGTKSLRSGAAMAWLAIRPQIRG